MNPVLQDLVLPLALALVAAIPGILSLAKQARKDSLDSGNEKSRVVLEAEKAAWERSRETIEKMEAQIAILEAKMSAMEEAHNEERDKWIKTEMSLRGKISKLETENDELKRRVAELESREY